MSGELIHAKISESVIGAAIEVHRELGPGLLESAYEVCLAKEMLQRGLTVRRQVDLPVIYKGERLDAGFLIDLLVDECLIVEVKCIEKVLPVHEAQLLTYLRLANLRVGLLINFHVTLLKNGIIRRVL